MNTAPQEQPGSPGTSPAAPPAERAAAAARSARERFGSTCGCPVFLRIIRDEARLELRFLSPQGRWSLLAAYPILAQGCPAEPKQREGDGLSPEGFYRLRAASLHPGSKYHLALNIGYPNAYDRRCGRTGSHIMIHGGARSVGCFAVGDEPITEIYGAVAEALHAGQSDVPVQIYPTRMEAPDTAADELCRHLRLGWQYSAAHGGAPYPDRDND